MLQTTLYLTWFISPLTQQPIDTCFAAGGVAWTESIDGIPSGDGFIVTNKGTSDLFSKICHYRRFSQNMTYPLFVINPFPHPEPPNDNKTQIIIPDYAVLIIFGIFQFIYIILLYVAVFLNPHNYIGIDNDNSNDNDTE
jgi:hypothetical protein